jgi:DHA1 family quinolone resistance protein-like MFS transporter
VITPFTTTIFVSGLLMVLLLVVIALFVKESPRSSGEVKWTEGFRQVPSMVRDAFGLSRKNPTILLLLGVTLASGLALASIESFWSPHFASLAGGSEGRSLFFGAIMAGSFLFGAVGNMGSIPLSRLFKQRYGLLASIFQGLQGAILIALALSGTVAPSVALFWMLYLSMGVINSPQATLMNEEIPSERRSAMLSVQSLAAYTGSIAGSVLLGYLAKNHSIGAAWIVAGIVMLVSLVLYLQVDARRMRKQEIIHEPETSPL